MSPLECTTGRERSVLRAQSFHMLLRLLHTLSSELKSCPLQLHCFSGHLQKAPQFAMVKLNRTWVWSLLLTDVAGNIFGKIP